VESVQVGVDTIASGRAKVVVVGGYDDFGEEGSYEFAQMKATSNAKDEEAAGRNPQEMSRPTTTTRGMLLSHNLVFLSFSTYFVFIYLFIYLYVYLFIYLLIC
jgi:hypothetical protein